MTEDEARARIAADVPRETLARLDAYVGRLLDESGRQNLISAATMPHIWQRHILDSVQLCAFGETGLPWLDIGSGAGLPGMVIAIVTAAPIILAEPRALRAAFLEQTAAELGLANVEVRKAKAQNVRDAMPATITARAVAGLPAIFEMARHLASPDTRWVLPRGRSAAAEVAEARRLWQGEFEIVPSATDSEAAIVIASNIRPRTSR